jgi:hypothetical protein
VLTGSQRKAGPGGSGWSGPPGAGVSPGKGASPVQQLRLNLTVGVIGQRQAEIVVGRHGLSDLTVSHSVFHQNLRARGKKDAYEKWPGTSCSSLPLSGFVGALPRRPLKIVYPKTREAWACAIPTCSPQARAFREATAAAKLTSAQAPVRRRRRIMYPCRSEDGAKSVKTNFKSGGLVAACPRSEKLSKSGS